MSGLPRFVTPLLQREVGYENSKFIATSLMHAKHVHPYTNEYLTCNIILSTCIFWFSFAPWHDNRDKTKEKTRMFQG